MKKATLAAAWLLLCLLALPACAEVIASGYDNPAAPSPAVPACERVSDEYFARAVFVGDSMADGFGIHGLLPEIQLFTRIGMSPRTAASDALFKNNGKAVTLAKKLPVMRPSAVYLWLGSNGLDGREAGKVIADYSRLLGRIIRELPDTPIYLLEVTPVMPLTQARYEGFTNARIDAFNKGLRQLARLHNVYILPVNHLLKGPDGYLVAEYAASDGIHLRAPAYQLLAEYIHTHALPALPEAEAEETQPDE